MWTLLVDHLWQSTLCVLLAWLLTLVLSRNAARVRYWVWLAASIKFLVPFSVLMSFGTLFGFKSDNSDTSAAVITIARSIAEPIATLNAGAPISVANKFDFMPVVFAIWAVGCALLAVRWLANWFKIRAIVKSSNASGLKTALSVRVTPMLS